MTAVNSEEIFYCKQNSKDPFCKMDFKKVPFAEARHTFHEYRKNTEYYKPQ